MCVCDLPEVWTAYATLLLFSSTGAGAAEEGAGAADEAAADEGAADDGAADEGSGTVMGNPALAQRPERTVMTFS